MSWPVAFTIVGVALAVALVAVALIWSRLVRRVLDPMKPLQEQLDRRDAQLVERLSGTFARSQHLAARNAGKG